MSLTKSILKYKSKFSTNPNLVAFLVFIFFSILFSMLIIQQYKIAKKAKTEEMNGILQGIHKSIEQSLKKNYVDALTLALTINDKGIPENFEQTAKRILASNPNIDAVQLVPNGIISYVYPLKENQAALGLNILKSKEHQYEALQSIKSRKMHFAGPFELKQGGLGILGRIPVYKLNRFWGFSAVIIHFNTLIKIPEISNIDSHKYNFQLSKIDPNTQKHFFFLNSNTHHKIDLVNAIESFIPDGNWKLYLIDLHPNSLIFTFVLRTFLAVCISLLISFLMLSFLKKPAELKLLLQQQAETLLKNEIKFKSMFDQTAVGITYVNTNTGQLLEANKKYCDLLGYTEQEIKQKDIEAIVHPDDLERAKLNFDKLRKGIIRDYSSERRHITKSGEIIWLKLTLSPLWKINSTPTTHIAIVEDITEQKLNEQTILNSQQKVESLINTIDGIVWECDAQTMEFTFVSEKVNDILGYSVEEWLNKENFWLNHIHSEDKEHALNFCQEQTAKLKNHDFEYRMIAKNGNIVWVKDIVNVIIEDGKAKNLRGIIIDITKTKEIETDLNNSFNVVSEQNKRLLNFSYIVSHNLRSHTSNITSIVDLINTTDSEEEKDELIQLLKSVSNSLNETMLNLNEVVNIQTNIGLTTEKLNLKYYIDNTLKILSDQIETKGITVISTITDEIEINYNPAYLESILYNLISNAVRYSHLEQNKPTITIDFFTENKKNILQVSDNGIGIDLKKNGHKIFGMYKKFSNHEDSKGIGLFITKNQIDAMGGNITVESEPNLGTTFKVYIS